MSIDRKKIDDIHKDVIEDLKKFNPIASKFEARLKTNLEEHYYKILDYVIEKYPSGNLYESTLLIQGITTRSLNLFLGVLRELTHSNVLVVNILLRQFKEIILFLNLFNIPSRMIRAFSFDKLFFCLKSLTT